MHIFIIALVRQMRFIFAAVILSTVVGFAGAQQATVYYHLGGSNTSPQNVPFTFSRSGDVTTVSWNQFGASADGAGVIYSANTDTFPVGYPISNLYGGNLEALTRWSFIFENGNGYLQLSSVAPHVTFRPNTASGAFSPGQIITVRPGSMKYYNKDVAFGGSVLATTNAVVATSLASTTGASIGASTTAVQNRNAGSAMQSFGSLVIAMGLFVCMF